MTQPRGMIVIRIAALVPAGLLAIFWLLYGIGDLLRLDWSGLLPALLALALLGLLLLVWYRPLIGGILLMLVSVGLYYLVSQRMQPPEASQPAALLMSVPVLLSALIALVAATIELSASALKRSSDSV